MVFEKPSSGGITIIVEHLDPELEEWQQLEYRAIAQECSAITPQSAFLLSGLQNATETASNLGLPSSNTTESSVESMFSSTEERARVCLLDPKAEKDLAPEDAGEFDVFVFGGILGDEPPRDRTAELRKLGFPGRRLGTEQMTTDTAARVTRMVVLDKMALDSIPYSERPDIEIPSSANAEEGARSGESVSMPFRYVRDEKSGKPVMPEGMRELLASDADKGIMDLL